MNIGEAGITAKNNTDDKVYTSHSILQFGCFKGKLISGLKATPNGRNYLVWMRKNGFKMSLQLMQFCEEQEKNNLIDSIGQSNYEKESNL